MVHPTRRRFVQTGVVLAAQGLVAARHPCRRRRGRAAQRALAADRPAAASSALARRLGGSPSARRAAPGDAFEHELYHLGDDPLQLENLAQRVPCANPSAEAERRRLHELLTRKMVRADALPPGFRWLAPDA